MLPSAQFLHADCAAASWNFPRSHSKHDVPSSLEYAPSAQTEHCADPAWGASCPEGQAVHCVIFVMAVAVPGGQFVHALAPTIFEKVPAAQSRHILAIGSRYSPGWQSFMLTSMGTDDEATDD